MASELDYSVVPADNTAVNGVGITGSDKPSNLDDAMRNLAANRANAQPRGNAKSSNYSAHKDDFGKLFSFSGAYTLTIPAISSVANGWYIYAEASGTASLTIARSGANTINGATSVVLHAGRRCKISVGVDASDVKVDFYSQAIAASSKSADYTIVPADAGALINADASAANRTITLPSLTSVGDGFAIEIKKVDASFNTVTVAGTVDGVTNKVLRLPGQSVVLVSDNTTGTWRVLAEAGTEYIGSTVNGEFTRHASGWQECVTVDIATDIATAAGNVFASPAAIDVPLPAAFVNTASMAPFIASAVAENIWGGARPLNTTTVRVRPFRYNAATGQSFRIGVKGRWF